MRMDMMLMIMSKLSFLVVLASRGSIFLRFWHILGIFRPYLGRIWAYLGHIWDISLVYFGDTFSIFWVYLGYIWATLVVKIVVRKICVNFLAFFFFFFCAGGHLSRALWLAPTNCPSSSPDNWWSTKWSDDQWCSQQYLLSISKTALLLTFTMMVMLYLTPRYKPTPPYAWLHASNSIPVNVDFKHCNYIHDGL